MKMNGYIDIHSHILPGIDDGAKSMEMTMEMVDAAYQQGVRAMIATPHYYTGHKNAPAKVLWDTYTKTKAAMEEKYKDFTLFLGNEIYYRDGCIDDIKKKEIFTLAGTRYILLEFATSSEYKYIYEAVVKSVNNGFYPVLAHVERYVCLYKDEKKIADLIRAGAYIQVNAENFKKGLFVPQRSFCMKLLQNRMIHFIGSDCHNVTERKPDLGLAIEYLGKKTDGKILDRILKENTQQLLNNKYI